jgi:molybdenum cofactor biosynthesis enzyme MoaA
VLDQGGPEHGLEAVEVGRAVVELSALSGFRKVRMALGEPMLRAL